MQIRLTEAEYEAIERKFRNSGLKSRSEFIRTMIFEGYLILINEDELKKLNQLIYNVANNINQIAVRVNSTGNVYADDISEIKEGQGGWIYVPRTKIKERTVKAPNRFVQDAIDRGNMKLASIAKNVIAEYGVEPDQIKQAAISEYAHSRGLLSELNNMKTEIEDLQVKLKVLRKYRKLKVYGEELKALSGSAAKKYRKEHSAELTEYGQIRTKVLELYPSGHIPTVESLDKKINALIGERSLKDQQFREADKRARDLADAQRTIEEFLRQERNEQQQDRKRKKNGDLE